MRKDSRHLQAFKEHFNLVGLSTAAAVSAALLNPLPLLVGLVAEAAYLLFVPDSRWYDTRLSRKHDAEVEARRSQLKAEVLPTLRAELQERFQRLETTRAQIAEHPTSHESWFAQILRKLDYLLEKYLLFGSREAQFRKYLDSVLHEVRLENRLPAEKLGFIIEVTDRGPNRRVRGRANDRAASDSVPPEEAALPRDPADRWVRLTIDEIQSHYRQEANEVRAQRQEESDPNTQAVLDKRLEVLERRAEGIGKIGRILLNLSQQLRLLEDTFGLINDEIRARSPEQVLSEIEEVVGQTESMTRLLEEIAPYEQMIARLKT
ncbi:MAG: hypothetical protein K0Q72_5336 [Armatimonadetes bacterium]|nr:hypothetical protein [Armatimonadota bacterium]